MSFCPLVLFRALLQRPANGTFPKNYLIFWSSAEQSSVGKKNILICLFTARALLEVVSVRWETALNLSRCNCNCHVLVFGCHVSCLNKIKKRRDKRMYILFLWRTEKVTIKNRCKCRSDLSIFHVEIKCFLQELLICVLFVSWIKFQYSIK